MTAAIAYLIYSSSAYRATTAPQLGLLRRHHLSADGAWLFVSGRAGYWLARVEYPRQYVFASKRSKWPWCATGTGCFQYRSGLPVHRRRLDRRAQGIHISMDGKGRWMDKVFIERLWRSLKYECVYLHAFEIPLDAMIKSDSGWITIITSGPIRVLTTALRMKSMKASNRSVWQLKS